MVADLILENLLFSYFLIIYYFSINQILLHFSFNLIYFFSNFAFGIERLNFQIYTIIQFWYFKIFNCQIETFNDLDLNVYVT